MRVDARIGALTGVHVVVLLQMSQLREALAARLALERSLAGVRAQVHLQVRQLTERLAAHVALVVHFPILFANRIRQRPVTARVARAAGTAARRHVVRRHRARRRRTARARFHRIRVAGIVALVATAAVLRREQVRLMVVGVVRLVVMMVMRVRDILDVLATGTRRRRVHEYGGRRATVYLQVVQRRQGFACGRVRADGRADVALRVRLFDWRLRRHSGRGDYLRGGTDHGGTGLCRRRPFRRPSVLE